MRSLGALFSAMLLVTALVIARSKNVAYYWIKPQNETDKRIAITFDDGPHLTLTPKLLDSLKGKNAYVTFYVMGVKAAKRAWVMRRAIAEGHEIASHVWDHPILTKISREEVYNQMLRTTAVIKAATNRAPTNMRPPYGNTNPKLNEYMEKRGNMSVVMWSFDTLDWKRPKPKDLIERAMGKIKAGDIVLCHDIHPGTIEAMPTLVDNLQKKGFQLVTVSDLINSDKNRGKGK
jgi:peptidoglycan-N-acetylglucosamine deacetylase